MNETRYIIFNRQMAESQGGWIHIVPKGEVPNRQAGVVQVLDDTALDSILTNIEKEKNRLGNRWPGIYGGEEHFFYDDDRSTEAFAWFKDFDKRADGIWAKDDGLTDLGQSAIKNRRFKYTSFVADPKDTEKLGGKKIRILAIETVGFTNSPTGKELLTPIMNRQEQFRRGLELSAGSEHEQTGPRAPITESKRMKSVATKLGLSADASEEAVLAEVTKIMNRATDAEGKVTPLTQRVGALETENATLLQEQIDADFYTNGIKDEKIINRHKPLLSDPKHFKNREERVAFIKDLAPKATAAGTPQVRLMNRDTKPPGAGKAEADAGAGDKVAAQKIMNRATALRKETPTLSLATAVVMAQREAEAGS